MPSLSTLLTLLTHYGYFLLFPIAILEGPIITVIAAFLASQGYLNVFVVYVVVVVADVFGDFLFYALGRWGHGIVLKHGHWLGVTPAKLEQARAYFAEHHHRSLILSKTVHGIGVVGLVAAGTLKVPYNRYFKTCISVSLLQSAFFTAVGFFLGHAYLQIEKYLNGFVAVISVVVLAVIISIIVHKWRNRKQ